jgi:hypothetical protein
MDYSNRFDSFEEWGYSGGNKQIILEQAMFDRNGKLPKDYKIFVFHGKAKFIQVDYNRFGRHTRAFYTSDWEKLDLLCLFPISKNIEEVPDELEEMLNYSEAIAHEIDFLRVDFYITNDGVKFGETTIYPGGGVDVFKPLELNRKIGSYWNINY